MSTPPQLTIIIVNWNTADLLAACLRSLPAPAGAWQVIVVDNASSDGSQAMVRRDFPWVELIANETNAGFARANNQGLRRARAPFALLLNSDAYLHDPNTVASLLDFLARRPAAGIVAPKLVNPDGSFQASYAQFPTIWSEFLLGTRLAQRIMGPYAPSPRPIADEPPRPVDWVAGAALMVRLAAVAEVGGLDESYFMYSEETDWCWRFRQHGWQVWYLPLVSVSHHAGASGAYRPVQRYLNLMRSKVQFFARAYGPGAAFRLKLLLLGLSLLRLPLLTVLALLRRRPAARLRWRQEAALLRAGWRWPVGAG